MWLICLNIDIIAADVVALGIIDIRGLLKMVHYSEATNFLIFRLCASILVSGVAVICFVVPGLVREQSVKLFSYLHSFCTGIMLAMGFIVYLFQSASATPQSSFSWSLLMSSTSFIFIIALELCSSDSAYDYRPINMNGEEGDEEEGVELTAMDEEAAGNPDFVPPSSVAERRLRFYPFVVLGFASLYDFLAGITLGYEQHSDYSVLIQYVVSKALMSCTFGTVLESLSAPPSIFQWFTFTFTICSPLGIMLGAYILPHMFASSVGLVPAVHSVSGYVGAFAAGTFLNIAVMNMIPAELYSMDASSSSAGSAARSSGSNNRILKLSAFVIGYVLTIAPYYLTEWMM